jgi:hypothetical protein
METLVISSKSKSNAQLISEFARKLEDDVEVYFLMDEDCTLTHFASESVLAKDWRTPEEDEAWKDL